MTSLVAPDRILVIRRDNIGDLICTTPMLHQLRVAYPNAWIGVLANRYNADVLAGNPDINAVFAYQKAKHRGEGVSRWSVWLDTAKVVWGLRQRKLDLVIVASPGGERFSRWLKPTRLLNQKTEVGHEVERCMGLLAPLGISATAGSLVLSSPIVHPAPVSGAPVVGFHISARKPLQRWPVSACVAFIRCLVGGGLASEVRLFWAPGQANDPLHPGDDEKLAEIMASVQGLPVVPKPSKNLSALIDGIAACDLFVCSDGGAMHIAAGLGKSVLCFFGNSGPERWHPWGVPQIVLQPVSLNVSDISVDEAVDAFVRLRASEEKSHAV